MPRPDVPALGRHVASLNLFQEADGYYITVAGGGIEPLHELMATDPELRNPMQALAVMIDEAGPRFVRTWRNWERGQEQEG